uniref:Uncharacterized protein n=2 Tax=Chromera velia CCMP2878 TaxID=1169474 RepID=A0A0K6SAR5_9ALVE|mmetsp:Transcript_13378/g.26442  ORF Transcript_13378/g.26442 Transcript_13378/m.26442 type:complete len:327 (+) Transcript_13378:257-1237(+)|eukprot:Cvel_10885.t1-p1 / transcript=Cvel_10885.t1 / gene=Cvel_10885 / organism=Chromera_velia_CCMP2878 / gene_product=hypothetical protein / transcript_product=hypothetical protein / location=Cvel_scaffold667:35608-37158(+) / protein_length=326 / sequence_SO=supercontig / SO=protein_coding / is_pseudo=false
MATGLSAGPDAVHETKCGKFKERIDELSEAAALFAFTCVLGAGECGSDLAAAPTAHFSLVHDPEASRLYAELHREGLTTPLLSEAGISLGGALTGPCTSVMEVAEALGCEELVLFVADEKDETRKAGLVRSLLFMGLEPIVDREQKEEIFGESEKEGGLLFWCPIERGEYQGPDLSTEDEEEEEESECLSEGLLACEEPERESPLLMPVGVALEDKYPHPVSDLELYDNSTDEDSEDGDDDGSLSPSFFSEGGYSFSGFLEGGEMLSSLEGINKEAGAELFRTKSFDTQEKNLLGLPSSMGGRHLSPLGGVALEVPVSPLVLPMNG